MQDLRIAIVQADLVWESPLANREQLDRMLDGICDCDLVVLPEMFATGFSMNPEQIAETMMGESLQWMLSRSRNFALCGSLAIEENGRFYNRFVCVYKGEILAQYDKRHLFAYAGEHEHYQAGQAVVQFEFKGWKLAPFVCYDLRFPAWIRQTAGVDIMLFVANWPQKRQGAWNGLLTARAIENQCYVLASNRVGLDGNAVAYQGDTQAIDMAGNCLGKATNDPALLKFSLSKSELEAFRLQFPFLNDQDRVEII